MAEFLMVLLRRRLGYDRRPQASTGTTYAAAGYVADDYVV